MFLFQDHPTINSIKIANNSISALENLPPEVKTLSISGNQLTSLLGVHNLHKLEHLELETCALTIVPNPQVFTQLSLLKTLSLAGNLLTRIPEELAYCRQLTSLDASENQIGEIRDGQLSVFPELVDLNLSGNSLRWFECPESVVNLMIHSNELEGFEIPAGLEQLQISDNCLQELDCTGRRNLVWLDFSKNRLRQIPTSIHHTRIGYCYGSENSISDLQ